MIIASAMLIIILAWSLCKRSKSFVAIDECVAYDSFRDKVIIKLPFKKSILLPNELRKSHRPVLLNHKRYEFYEDYVLINSIKFNF